METALDTSRVEALADAAQARSRLRPATAWALACFGVDAAMLLAAIAVVVGGQAAGVASPRRPRRRRSSSSVSGSTGRAGCIASGSVSTRSTTSGRSSGRRRSPRCSSSRERPARLDGRPRHRDRASLGVHARVRERGPPGVVLVAAASPRGGREREADAHRRRRGASARSSPSASSTTLSSASARSRSSTRSPSSTQVTSSASRWRGELGSRRRDRPFQDRPGRDHVLDRTGRGAAAHRAACEDLGIATAIVPRLFERMPALTQMEHLGGLPSSLRGRRSPPAGSSA